MNTQNYDFIIVGAGIIGLSVAYELLQQKAGTVLVIDKENEVAKHQSSHNSGVIHAGVYYKPGSLKAAFCKQGVAAITEFCDKYQINYKKTGKLIVATDDKEHQRMLDLYQRAQQNSIDISLLDKTQAKDLEPNIQSVGALLSPSTAIVDYQQVCHKLAELIVDNGGKISLGERIVSADEKENIVYIKTNKHDNYQANYVITCAGLHSDKVAKLFHAKVDYKVIPFRGEFFEIKNQPNNLVNHLIYPVPDPERPFLGVHITRKVSGKFAVGPNAVLAGSREGYKLSQVSVSDTMESLSYKGFWKMLSQNFLPAMTELKSSLSKQVYLKRVQRYCPQIKLNDLVHYPAGVRAQAVADDGEIIDDFKFIETERVLHVCNAPSPAATASLPIGKYIVNKVLAE